MIPNDLRIAGPGDLPAEQWAALLDAAGRATVGQRIFVDSTGCYVQQPLPAKARIERPSEGEPSPVS
jgi:hypothetical protein